MVKIENIKYENFDSFLKDVVLPTGELEKSWRGLFFEVREPIDISYYRER